MERIEIKEGLGLMLRDAKAEMKGFSKKTYEGRFDALYQKYVQTLIAVEVCYKAEGESVDVLDDLATGFPSYLIAELELTKKREREVLMLDHNMAMVTYILPLIGKRTEDFMGVFQQRCVEQWNLAFKKSKIQCSSKADIDGGFKNGLCYITTAVCGSMNKPDDCYELQLLRNYRDNYLLSSEAGTSVVKRYYDIAPTIVKRIDKEVNSQEIYHHIWNDYLTACIQKIESGDKVATQEIYSEMVEELAEEYFH